MMLRSFFQRKDKSKKKRALTPRSPVEPPKQPSEQTQPTQEQTHVPKHLSSAKTSTTKFASRSKLMDEIEHLCLDMLVEKTNNSLIANQERKPKTSKKRSDTAETESSILSSTQCSPLHECRDLQSPQALDHGLDTVLTFSEDDDLVIWHTESTLSECDETAHRRGYSSKMQSPKSSSIVKMDFRDDNDENVPRSTKPTRTSKQALPPKSPRATKSEGKKQHKSRRSSRRKDARFALSPVPASIAEGREDEDGSLIIVV